MSPVLAFRFAILTVLVVVMPPILVEEFHFSGL